MTYSAAACAEVKHSYAYLLNLDKIHSLTVTQVT